jgi:hypothetical protein
LQASALAQHCLPLEAAAAAEGQRCAELRSSYQLEAQQLTHSHQLQQQQLQQQQQQQQQAGDPAVPVHEQQPAVLREKCTANTTAAAVAAAAEPLLLIAQQLQQEVEGLAGHNQQLLAAAKKLCSSFRSGGRAVRVRALSLKLELQQHGIPAVEGEEKLTTAGGHTQQVGAGYSAVGAAAAADVDALPAAVAASVVQHWNEVETLLAQLHQSSEALLLPPHQSAPAGKQQHVEASSSSNSASRKRAVRKCRKLLEGLQQVLGVCQDHNHHQQQPALQQQSPQQRQLSGEKQGAAVAAPSMHAARAAAGTSKQSRPEQQARTQQQQQQQVRLPAQAADNRSQANCGSGSSTASSEGLGTLLAAVQKRPAAQDMAGCAQRRSHLGNTAAVRQPVKAAVFGDAVAAAGMADQQRRPVAGHAAPASSSIGGVATAQAQCQQQQHQHQHKEQHQGGASDVQYWAAGAHTSVRDSAVIRRAERTALMERLRLLQQQTSSS